MGRGLSCRIILLGLALLIGGCGELTPPSERRGEIGYHTVRSGDTLYSIAWDYGLDYHELADWNSVSPPYLIHPGQRLSLTPPFAGASASARSAKNSSTKPFVPSPKAAPKTSLGTGTGGLAKPHRSKTTKKVDESNKKRRNRLSQVENTENATTLNRIWRWPTAGKVVAGFDAGSGKKGIDITGRSGQSIFSAAAGDVVYSGSGLLGYGKLVIIKHDDVYLSAYGHNSQLLVKEGDKVAMGQEIAKMGVSPKDGAVLHFEIRREGKPVDPTRYLPKKN